MQKKLYRIADKVDSRKIAEFLAKDGQLLLPFLELICNTEQAVDELIDVVGKGAIEAVLLLSAEQLAGPKQPGKAHGEITWHGRQHGDGSKALRCAINAVYGSKNPVQRCRNHKIRNVQDGLSKNIHLQCPASLKAWMRYLRSMRWDCQRCFVVAWVRQILLSHPTVAFALEPGG